LDFEIIGKIKGTKQIASGSSIREQIRLNKMYGEGRWRKIKGYAKIRLN